MKNLLLIFFTSFVLISCDKDDNPQPVNPVDQLPPATQTGKNTFGCLLDGKVFTPGNGANPLDCVYQLIDGEYYFSLQANSEISTNLIRIGCSTQKLQISQGSTYQLNDKIDGNAFGKYFFETDFSYTSQIQTGELKITKLDFTKNIVSGTFWFDVEDANGIIHQIREGRFDMQFTQ